MTREWGGNDGMACSRLEGHVGNSVNDEECRAWPMGEGWPHVVCVWLYVTWWWPGNDRPLSHGANPDHVRPQAVRNTAPGVSLEMRYVVEVDGPRNSADQILDVLEL